LAFAVAEGAALLVFVGSAPVGRAPRSAGDPFTTLPVQVYQWAGRPEPGFRELAWAGLLALGVLVLTLRGCAALMASRPGD
jgi:phosphate transport system permease protein